MVNPPSRMIAAELIDSVLRRRHALDESLDNHGAFQRLQPRDRAFVRLTVATVLRRVGQIDDLLGRFLSKRPKDPVIEDLMRIGAAHLLFLEMKPHAAVSEVVKLAGKRPGPFKGLVNAVLRKVSAEGPAILGAQDAARLNTPDWLWESWVAAYGEPAARAIAEANMTEAMLDLTAKGDPAEWAQRLDARILPTGTLRREPGGDIRDLPGFNEGVWWVQDAAAALPAKLMGDIAGLRVADLCAAPGGKTAQLAAAGAKVTALDLAERRLKRLTDNLTRLGLTAETVAADARSWEAPEPFDAVLLDAPCSSTGAMRRHPDVQRLKTPADIAKLADVQAALLRHAVDLVKPGGTLVYCTCSIQPEEGEARVDALLAEGLPLERSPIRPDEVGGLAEIVNERGEIRSLPCHLKEWGGIDGFFVARLKRTG